MMSCPINSYLHPVNECELSPVSTATGGAAGNLESVKGDVETAAYRLDEVPVLVRAQWKILTKVK